MSLLQMSFSGGVLILVILALRAVTIHRLPKTTFLTLWWVALLRLLIPLSIPSVFSAYSWLTTFFHTADNLVESPVMNFLPPAAMPPVQAGTALPQVLPEPEPLSVWFVLWCAGATVCAIFYLASYFRCRYEFQTALPVKKDVVDRWLADHPLRRTIRVRQSDRIASPLTYGLFRPVILLPKKTDWEDEAHLSYILLHEFIHIRRCDVAAKLLLLLALCLHWFNPLVWVLAALFNRDLELACDEQVLRASAGDTRSDYATLLIHMEECRGGYAPLFSHFSQNAMEERVTAIMKTRKRSLLAILAAVVLIALVAIPFATSPKEKDPAPGVPGTSSIQAGDLPAPVMEQARAFTAQRYEETLGTELDHSYVDWRVESLEHAYSYDDLDGMALEIYRINYRFLSAAPETVVLAGGMDMDGEGWVLPTYPNSNYLVFEKEGETLTYLTAILENDCSPGDETFTGDLRARLSPIPPQDTVLTFMVEGVEETVPAQWVRGTGFSLCLPAGEWELVETDTWVSAINDQVLLWVTDLGAQSEREIRSLLVRDGYTVTPDGALLLASDTKDGRATYGRIQAHSGRYWGVFYAYPDTSEYAEGFGVRLPVIANTLVPDGALPAPGPDDLPSARQEKLTLAGAFADAYFRGDETALTSYLTQDYGGDVDLWTGDPAISCEEIQLYGEKDTIASVPFLEGDSYTYLTMELVNDAAGWRVAWYGLDK